MEIIKIAIADDHPAIGLGIRACLHEEPSFELVAFVDSGDALFSEVDLNSIDIAMIDLMMPGMDGIQVAEKIRLEYPNLKIIVVSANFNSDSISSLANYDIEGYLYKENTDPENLIKVIREVAAGNTHHDENLRKLLYQHTSIREETAHVRFTPMEIAIIPHLMKFKTYKEIAAALGIKERTVEWHTRQMRQRSDTKNNNELLKFIRENPHTWMQRESEE